MDKIKFTLPPMVAKMTAKGKVVNPDGSEQDFTMTADVPIKSGEEEDGNHPISGS